MEKKSLLLLVLITFLVFSISLSFVSAYTFNDVLSGKVSFSNYIKEKVTGKAVVQDAEAKGFTSQGTWLKSWIPNLKSVYNGDILIGDFNGDGKTDIGVYDGVKGNWMIANSNGNGFDATGVWLKSWLPKVDYGEGNTFTGDFNGDGKTDIGVYDSINGNWLVALSTGTGFTAKYTWLKSWLSGYSGNIFTGDFNGDGKTDIGAYDAVNGNWSVALASEPVILTDTGGVYSSGGGFTIKGTWLAGWLPKRDYGEGNIFTGDFNGDGKTDIGVYDAMNGNWLVATSNGTGFTAKYTWLKSWLPKRDYGEGNTFTGDFNGDGKTDIGVYDAMNGNWLVALASEPVILTDTGGVYSSGGGFSTKAQGWLSGWLPKRDYGEGNTFTGDFNGDGKTDIGVYDAMNGNWLVALATSTPSYCVDTDNGAVYTKKGNVYGVELGNAFDKADYCLNNTLIREYYCHGANAVISDYKCPDSCKDGTCVTSKQIPQAIFAIDSTSPTSDVRLLIDISKKLEEEGYLVPAMKLFNEVNALDLDYNITLAIYNSEARIIIGAKSTTEQIILSVDIASILDNFNVKYKKILSSDVKSSNLIDLFISTCTDSDGGMDYYVKGFTKGTNREGYDFCSDSNSIIVDSCSGKDCYQREYSCEKDDRAALGMYNCPYGCNDGACLTPTVIQPEREEIIIAPAPYSNSFYNSTSDDKMIINFTDYLGNLKVIQWARSLSSSVIDLQHDSDEHRIIVAERANANRSDMIVVGDEDKGHLVKVSQIVNQTTGYSQDKVTFEDVFTGDTYTSTLTAEGTGTVTIGGKVYNVNYFGDSSSSEDARTVRLNYPDSIDTNTMIIYPTIQTRLGAKVAFYKPLIIDKNNWDGLNNKLKTLKIPNGNGYTDVDISTLAISQKMIANIAKLNYQITNVGGLIFVFLVSPKDVNSIISDPGLILIEEKDNNGEFNSIIVTLEAGNTGADGIGVSNVYRTWSNDSVCDEKYQGNNQFKEADFWGAIVTLNATDSDQAKAAISYPDTQVNLDLKNCNFSVILDNNTQINETETSSLLASWWDNIINFFFGR